jgi:ferredoxin-NADP reductase
MSMIRHRAAIGSTTPTRLLYSSRSYEDIIYRAELEDPADGLEVFHTLTRSQPSGWTGYARRIDAEMLGEVAWPVDHDPRVFICGSTRFVDTAADGLVAMGYPALSIRTERFGATG